MRGPRHGSPGRSLPGTAKALAGEGGRRTDLGQPAKWPGPEKTGNTGNAGEEKMEEGDEGFEREKKKKGRNNRNG
jgi:hypothetical protein